MKKRIALSWSGGKDACLALHTLVQQNYEIVCLVTTVPKELKRTFGHGEKREMIELQGKALNLPVHFIECTFENYTDAFIDTLIHLKNEHNISSIAFGDLYLDGHREWGEKVATSANLESLFPLWMKKEDAPKALENFVHSGYEAVIIRTKEDVLDERWLGRKIDLSFLSDVNQIEMCPMGESGEYHTYVVDGPLFSSRIQVEHGEIIELETTKKLEFKSYKLIEK